MENFKDLETGGSVPDKNSGSILTHAFELYKGILLYPIIAGVIVFIIVFILLSVTGLWGIIMEMSQNRDSMAGYNAEAYEDLYRGTPFLSFMGSFSLVNILVLSPLVVGTIYVAHKKNLNQQIEISDLFIGYKQNFINIVLYGLIFSIAVIICTNLCYVPAVFVMPFFFLGFPFLLFQNVTAIEALKRSFDIAKDNYGEILLINLLAYLCSCLGFIACCIGIIVTYMFYYSTMYSAYCAYVALPRQIEQN